MKKLRMIVTSIIVIVIVGSAFAFNVKKWGTFCVSVDGDSICDQIIRDYKIVFGTSNFKYTPCWDGTWCTYQTTCTTDVRLITD